MRQEINIKATWEDEIYRVKEFLNGLAKMQDQYFLELLTKMNKEGYSQQFNKPEDGDDYLFDYIFNCSDDETFDEYLDRFRSPTITED